MVHALIETAESCRLMKFSQFRKVLEVSPQLLYVDHSLSHSSQCQMCAVDLHSPEIADVSKGRQTGGGQVLMA